MAWQEGNQKRRLSKTRDINKELLEGDLGFLEEKEAKLYCISSCEKIQLLQQTY